MTAAPSSLRALSQSVTLGLIALTAPFLTAAEPANAAFTLKDQPGEYLDVLQSGKIVGRYMYAHDKARLVDTYKPYVHVFDAEGEAPITKGPGGQFTHHRGIFIGWSRLSVAGKSYDRWHMKGGEQVHQEFLTQQADAAGARLNARIDWMDEAAHPILSEERAINFLPPPSPAYAYIDITSKLKAIGGETILKGDPEHAGFQYRPADEVNKAETVYVFPGQDANPQKDRDYPWLGETYMLKGKRYSVVYLNHPSNPKGTIFSAYRDYGRFGGYFQATIPKDGEQNIRCAFLITAGEMPSAEWIQKAYNTFAGVNDPTPPITVKSAAAKGKPPAAPAPEKK